MAFQPPPYTNKNTWLSSHHPTQTKHMAFQPPPNRQSQNTWLSSHHPTETKHMAFQPPPYTNKTHGFPATTLHKQNTWLSSHHLTQTKHMAFQPPLPETQAFSQPGMAQVYGKCLLRGLWLSSQCKIEGFRPPIFSFQLRQYPSWPHSSAFASASLQLSHSSLHP